MHRKYREENVATIRALYPAFFLLALAACSTHAVGQNFYYLEPGLASCPQPEPKITARTLEIGKTTSGKVIVQCGFEAGSYTVILNSSDPDAIFSPKTFIINFGRVVGTAAFTVSFSTVGVQSVSTVISSNMGSPPVRGQFVSPNNAFNVVRP